MTNRTVVMWMISVCRLLFAAGLLLNFSACGGFRTVEVRKFRESFKGYVLIVWGIPNHAPLPIQNEKMIEDFTSDKVIITSSPQQFGMAWDENYFVQENGNLVPALSKDIVGATGAVGQANKKMLYSVFYVRIGGAGTKEDSEAFSDSNTKLQGLYQELIPNSSHG
jgi:uncharacterized protein DUF6843